MSKWKFEPSDFQSYTQNVGGTSGMYLFYESACRAANAKLDEWRRSATVVYAGPDEGDTFPHVWGSNKSPMLGDTHRALLIDIQPLEKEPCKHEPSDTAFTFYPPCKHCGVKLKATWSEDK